MRNFAIHLKTTKIIINQNVKDEYFI